MRGDETLCDKSERDEEGPFDAGPYIECIKKPDSESGVVAIALLEALASGDLVPIDVPEEITPGEEPTEKEFAEVIFGAYMGVDEITLKKIVESINESAAVLSTDGWQGIAVLAATL